MKVRWLEGYKYYPAFIIGDNVEMGIHHPIRYGEMEEDAAAVMIRNVSSLCEMVYSDGLDASEMWAGHSLSMNPRE